MSRPPRTLRVLGLSILITILMSMGAASAAWAYFTSTGTARGAASVGTLGAPTITTASPGAGAVTLRWSDVTPPTSTVSYFVTRDGGAPAGDCPTSTAPTTATTCSDSGLSVGSHAYTVTVVWRSWTAVSATTHVSVASRALDHFALVLVSPQVSGAGFTQTNTLTAQDASGNTVTSFNASTSNVTITANGALTGTVSGLHGAGANVLNQAADFTNGVANLTALGLTYTGAAGTGTFTATTTSGTTGKTGTSGNVTITGGALDHFLIQAAAGGSITSQTAGSAFAVKITAQDVANNTATGFTGTVDVSSNRTCSAGCATTAAFTAGVLSSQSLTLTQAGALSTIPATDHAATGKTGTSNTFAVNPAAASKMVFVNCFDNGITPAIDSPTCAGQPFTMGNNTNLTFNMQTQDPFGNPSAPGSAITITFTNSDSTFSITPASITTAAATSGQVTLHHGNNGSANTLTASAGSGFADATLGTNK